MYLPLLKLSDLFSHANMHNAIDATVTFRILTCRALHINASLPFHTEMKTANIPRLPIQRTTNEQKCTIEAGQGISYRIFPLTEVPLPP